MQKLGQRIAVLALMALFSTATTAAVIYEQASHSTVDRGAFQHFGQELADDFTALATGTLSLATWRGSYYSTDNGTGTESFTLNLFAGGASTPGALIYSTVGTATFVAAPSPTYYDYTLTLTGPVLTAGTEYWVSIYSNDSPSNYAWGNSTDGTSGGAIRSSGGAWSTLGGLRGNHVFSLQTAATVPATAPLALVALGEPVSCQRTPRSVHVRLR